LPPSWSLWIQVEPHELLERGVLADAEHVGQVAAPVELRVRGDVLAVEVGAAEDVGRDVGELGDEVHDVLERGIPILIFGHLLFVAAGELRILLELQDGHRELGHRVRVLGDGVHDVDEVLGQDAALLPLFGDLGHVRGGRDVAHEEEIEDALGQGLGAAGGLGQLFAELRDGEAAEADALELVEERDVPEHRDDVPGAADDLADVDLGDVDRAVFLAELLDPFFHRAHLGEEFLFECRHSEQTSCVDVFEG
jgi:hypothetical protein